MKRGFAFLLALCLTLCCAAPACALITRPGLSGQKGARTYTAMGYGEESENVRELQERLYDLGYLKDKPDGEYGGCTTRAVEYFQAVHSMTYVTGYADVATQEKIYSGDAKPFKYSYYDDYDIPEACVGWYLEWKNVSKRKDTVDMRVKVINTRDDLTLDAFTIYAYFEDVYGNRLHDGYYYWTTKKKVKPLKIVYSDYCRFDAQSDIYYCYFAIKKDHVKNGGTTEQAEEDLDFIRFIYNP